MDIGERDMLELLRRVLTPEQIERSIIYWDRTTLAAGARITAGMATIAMPFAGTMVFVDLAPRANWAHPCLYVLVDYETLATQVVPGSFPPREIASLPESVFLRDGKRPAQEPRHDANGHRGGDTKGRRSQ